jgi:REP element-mobilizing transposase RayT
MEWTNPRATPFVPIASRGGLPHLYKPGGFYFVTFRLADAVVPKAERTPVDPGAAWGDALGDPDPWELMQSYRPPLTLGSCSLKRPEIATLVQNALLHFEGQRYSLVVWCIMPNHAHAIVAPEHGHVLPDILKSWKGFTARQANRILNRKGAFWERESFDHLIRGVRGLERFGSYVEMNPVEAGLCSKPQDWPYSSAGVGFHSTIWRR